MLLFYCRDAFLVSFIGEGTSIFSGLVVFTILGFIAHDLGVPIDEVVKSGTYLSVIKTDGRTKRERERESETEMFCDI